MSDWPLEIDGREYAPIPASWLAYGTDHGHGSPRVYAVSVAQSVRDLIQIRYLSRDGGVYVQSTSAAPNPTGDGMVPASLAKFHDWPRSIVPPSHVDPVDTARDVERAYLVEHWADRVDDLDADDGRRAVADGGRPVLEEGEKVYLDTEDALRIALEQSEDDRQRELIREALQLCETPARMRG